MKRFGLMLAAALLAILVIGMAAAEADSPVITSVSRDPYGDVYVTWNGGTAPYKLVYYAVDGADSTVWTVSSGLYARNGSINDLAPNFDFVIGVVDANGEYGTYTRKGTFKRFSDVSGMRLTFTLRQRVNGRSKTINQYSATAIRNSVFGSGDYYGATIKLSGYSTTQALPFTFRMAVTMPDGEPLVFYVERGNLPRGSSSSYVYWDFFDFSDLWSYIYTARGEIPTGNYTYYIYLDDGLVSTAAFSVGP